jgi:folate-dependent phosphoribosylglycinamide formyltransferase PurN
MNENIKRKSIVFLSSSMVNLAKMFAENYKEYDVFLVLDRKFPTEFEDLDNFYSYLFEKNKVFEKNKEKYFDYLGIFIEEFKADFIVCNNFTKLLPKSFIDFAKFRNSNTKILNIHNADLREGKVFKGLNAEIAEFLEDEEIITTIHLIEDEKMDEGKQLNWSHPTTLKELKQKGLANKKEDILNYRLNNVITSYHERTKVLRLLYKTLEDF